MLKEEEVKTLIRQLERHLLENASLGVAGQFVYYASEAKTEINRNGTLVLAVHTTSPEETLRIAQIAWDSISGDFKQALKDHKLGFAVKQI